MTEAQFQSDVTHAIRARVRSFVDHDYGSPTDSAIDPRNEDPRGFDDLDPAEQRRIIEAGLADGTMDVRDLVNLAMDALDDARVWRSQFCALQFVTKGKA